MSNREQLMRQKAAAPPNALHPDRGTEYEQRRYLNGPARRQREQLLRQFINGDGPRGNTDAYRDGWDRVFGGRHGE